MATKQVVSIAPRDNLFFILGGFTYSKALFLINKLNVAGQLAGGEKSINELSKRLNANPDALHRLMRMLASVNIFEEVAEGVFSNNASSRFLIPNTANSLNLFVSMFDEEFISNPLRDAVNTVETGKPSVKRTLGMEIFEHFSANPKDGDIFNKAMEQLSQENMQSIIDCYDFSCCNTIADLGGGYGNLLKGILAKYPEKKGVCFDFFHVIESLPKEMTLQSNLRFEGGSLFDKVPENADTYILKHVIHGFNDELCLQVLRNCKKVMDHNSRLLIIDAIADPNEKYSYTHFMDFIMLMFTGGKERNENEIATLLEQAGLKINGVFDSGKKDKVIEALVI